MKNYLKFSIVSILFILTSVSIYAQVAITAVPFFGINNDARSMGMAGATVALKGSKGGLHLNPATFGKRNVIELSSQFNTGSSDGFLGTPWLSNQAKSLELYTPQFIIGFDNFSIGYQYTFLDLGESTLSSSTSSETIGKSRSYEYAHTFSSSYSINKNIAIGIGFSYFKSRLVSDQSVSENSVSYSESGLTVDLGVYTEYSLRFDFITATPSLGWSLADIGQPIRYGSGQEDPLHTLMRGGAGLRFDIEKSLLGLRVLSVGGYGSLSKIMARRHNDGTPYGPLKAIFGSWGVYERFNGQETTTLSLADQIRRQSGLEIVVLEILSFRLGRYYEHPENGDRKYDTFGLGVQYKYFSFDYATINTDEENHPLQDTDFVQFTLNIPVEILGNLIGQFR